LSAQTETFWSYFSEITATTKKMTTYTAKHAQFVINSLAKGLNSLQQPGRQRLH